MTSWFGNACDCMAADKPLSGGAQRALYRGFHRGGRSARRSVSRTTFDTNVQHDARAAGTYGLSAIKLMAGGMGRT
jgi:hypothetical protein